MAKLGCLVGFVGCLVIVACGGASSSGFDGGTGKDGTVGNGGSSGHGGSGGSGGSGGINLGGNDAGDSPAMGCTGIACNVQSCSGGAATEVSGYVYAPNGQLPLYDVQVFIPNAALAPLSKGVQCENCGAPLSGEPITATLSDPTGHFVLTGVPTGANVPIVVQLGKWRREAFIPTVTGCTMNPLSDPNLTRLPKNQMEGSIPHVALTTGGCDQMGCMLAKIGLDPTEFGTQADGYNKAINVYNGSGGSYLVSGATAAMNLWGDATNLATYDEAIFSCECSESPGSKGTFGSPAFGVVTDYLNAGGRIFTTDFQYTWYKYSPDPMIGETTAGTSTTGLGQIAGGAPVPEPYPGQPPMVLSTAIPKSVALAAWLKNIFSGVALPSGATYPLDTFSQMGEVSPDVIFCNVQSLNPAETVLWASSDQTGGGPYGGGCTGTSPGPRIFTVDTPVGVASTMQCGRGVHIDAHVDQGAGNSVGPGFPTTGCSATLKADEAAFAFFFFDLSSCISNEHMPPPPPPTVK